MRLPTAARSLEPVCCKKQQKKFPTSYWFVEYGTSEDSDWYKIDPGWSGESLGLIYNQIGIIQVLQMSPIPQISNWSGTFFCCFLQQTGSKNKETLQNLQVRQQFRFIGTYHSTVKRAENSFAKRV